MDLFDEPGRPEEQAYLRRLRTFVAPIVAHRNAVIDDPDVLEVADAVYAAFGDGAASGGLTRSQIASACAGACDEATFNSRFEVFVGEGMLHPFFDKANQQRYIFDMTSAAGLLVWGRLAERGGVDELISLLDRTQAALRDREASREQVGANLKSCRRWLQVAADHLFQMVANSPLAELIAVRRHHAQEGLVEKVRALSRIVAEVYPDLDPEMYRVLRATFRYTEAREAFIERLLDEGGRARDFSLLDAEQYLEAALTRDLAGLSEAFADVVVDPPNPWVDPTSIAETLNKWKPKPRPSERPPRPTVIESDEDPVAKRTAAEAADRARRDRQIEMLLAGASHGDTAFALRSRDWPEVARRVVDLLAANADPNSPFTAVVSDELLVDPDGTVTYFSPITVLRTTSAEAFDAGLSAMTEDADDPVGASDE